MSISLYAGLDFYERAEDQRGKQLRGDAKQFWLKPLVPGQAAPPIFTITAASAATADAEEISVSADVSVKVYRGDILSFGANNAKLVVVAADTTIGVTPTDLPILPLISAITENDTARTYALLPAVGVTDGGTPNTTGSTATGRTRAGSLFELKEMITRSYTIDLNGIALSDDPTLAILESLSLGKRRVFWQSRWHPYTVTVDELGQVVTNGMGVGARTGIAFVNSFNPTVAANDMVRYTANLEGDGRHDPYILLTD